MKKGFLKIVPVIFLILSYCSNLEANENKKVVIAVKEEILYELDSEIDRFSHDLILEGWFVKIEIVSKDESASFKETLLKWNKKHNMNGIILIGSFPFEDDPDYANIKPILNRMYGGALDFWISRIDSRLLNISNISEVELLKSYFEKNHRYRKNTDSNSNSATFISDRYSGNFIGSAMSLYSFGSINYLITPNADDFFNQTDSVYSFLSMLDFHGSDGLIAISDSAITSLHLYNRFSSKSKFIDLFSCKGGSYKQGSVAAHLLFSPKSHVLAVLARPKLAWSPDAYINSLGNLHQRTVGDVFIYHNLSWFFLYETAASFLPRLIFNNEEYLDSRVLFGDGTISILEK